MLKLSVIELFLRLIPEGLILALSIYAFSNETMDKKRYIISAVILSINPFFVRMLPISFGVHTIILIMLYILIAVNINGVNVIEAIRTGLLTYIILAICELVNVFLVVNVLNISTDRLLGNITVKTLAGSPSLVVFFIIVYLFYKRKIKKEVNKDVYDRKIIK